PRLSRSSRRTRRSAAALVVDTFEVSLNRDLTNAQIITVPRGDGQTSVVVRFLNIDVDYYWRVRAASGEQAGPVSEPSRFRIVGEPLRVPALVSPANGAAVSLPVTLLASGARHVFPGR